MILSLLIPVYNARGHLAGLLGQLRAQAADLGAEDALRGSRGSGAEVVCTDAESGPRREGRVAGAQDASGEPRPNGPRPDIEAVFVDDGRGAQDAPVHSRSHDRRPGAEVVYADTYADMKSGPCREGRVAGAQDASGGPRPNGPHPGIEIVFVDDGRGAQDAPVHSRSHDRHPGAEVVYADMKSGPCREGRVAGAQDASGDARPNGPHPDIEAVFMDDGRGAQDAPVHSRSHDRRPGAEVVCTNTESGPRPGIEIVFVDDGSTDGSAALIEAAAGSFPMPLRLLRQANAGASAARNAALRAARGEYVAFVDADDLLAPDYLERLCALAAVGGFDALFFGIARVLPGETLPPAGSFEARPAGAATLLDEFLRDPKRFGPYSMLLRRGFLLDAGLRFAEGCAYYEDYDFLARVALAAGRLLRARAVLYGYRMAEGSAMARFSAERFRCLALARETARAVDEALPGAGARFGQWFEARLYWSVLWQACLALPSPRDARRFLRATEGTALLRRLRGFPDRRVAATARLARLCPEAFALLARRGGRGRSLIVRLRPGEAEALIAGCRAPEAAPGASLPL